jgi:hypothetical protein
VPDGAYDAGFLQQLRSLDVDVRQETKAQVLSLRGTAAFVTIDETGRILRCAEDPNVIDFADAN